jgi:hypothetical protein
LNPECGEREKKRDVMTGSIHVGLAALGGAIVRVGSDVIDRSVQAGIAELKRRFGIASQNGSRPQIGDKVLSPGSSLNG